MNYQIKKQKNNDHGFTLVELIIVVAIIAVLSAVSAPQFIKYVEHSRIGVDEAYIGEVSSTLGMVAATDIKINTCPVTVTFDNAGKIQGCTAAGPDADENAITEAAVDAYMMEMYPVDTQTFESNHYKAAGSGVSLVLDAEGVVTISGTKNIDT